MKLVLDKMKGKYPLGQNRAKINQLQSSQVTAASQYGESQYMERRSRAFSNALHPLRESDAGNKINFIDYKKGKKELSYWMKND